MTITDIYEEEKKVKKKRENNRLNSKNSMNIDATT